ncbi:MAG TPA: LuxR C-terminal-related transcriptional regulator [Pseudosphingobacterium sp.]|nr:LuxR C-terminal-related transcriptional regulator [Pseudosphingobacterium sp.]
MSNRKSMGRRTLQQGVQAQLLTIGNNLRKGEFTLEDIGDHLPGSVMLQDLPTATNLYMNQYGCEKLRHSSEELKALGPDYFRNFFPQDEILVIRKELTCFLQQQDPDKIFPFYQRVRTGKNGDYEWYFTSSRIADEEGQRLIHVALPAAHLETALFRSQCLAPPNEYACKNYALYSALTKRERELITLIAEGRTSSYIAENLFLSIHTVNNHRKNIIRKLEINSLAELIRFAMAFGLL